MKKPLMALAGLFILGGSLGFRPATDAATATGQNMVERSNSTPYLPVVRPPSRTMSAPSRGKGVILSINFKESMINVRGVWIHVSSETSINATAAVMMGIESLVPGTSVQVYGMMNKDGSITASRIDLLPS